MTANKKRKFTINWNFYAPGLFPLPFLPFHKSLRLETEGMRIFCGGLTKKH